MFERSSNMDAKPPQILVADLNQRCGAPLPERRVSVVNGLSCVRYDFLQTHVISLCSTSPYYSSRASFSSGLKRSVYARNTSEINKRGSVLDFNHSRQRAIAPETHYAAIVGRV